MKTLTALTLVLAVFAASTSQADADTTKKKVWHHKHYAANSVRPQVRGWIARGAGGHAYGYEYEPFLYKNGPYGNYPYFDDRNFWERVQSDPFSTRPGVSAY